jgi:hypothetical protein
MKPDQVGRAAAADDGGESAQGEGSRDCSRWASSYTAA